MTTKAVEGNSSLFMAARIAKWFLWLASWTVAMFWLVLWFKLPTTDGKAFKTAVATKIGHSTFYGKYATNYVLYSGPVIVLAILALMYLELNRRYPERRKSTSCNHSTFLRVYRDMWTQPLLVKTPLGILTLVDIIIIAVVLLGVIWLWAELMIPQFDTINATKPKKGVEKWQLKLDKTSAMLGRVLPFTVALLFLPITRGSPILRLIDVPFEQAVRYHRWIGYLTVLLVFVHGATYAVYWGTRDQLHLLVQWEYTGISNLAGVIAGVSGVVMMFTALPYVRVRFFNVFYSVHHLYLIFFAFYVFHVDWNHAGFRYSALSFLYLNIPGISRLQWHPFSVTSSHLDGYNELSVCIKPLGDWTHKLHNDIAAKSSNSKSSCPFAVKLHAEGPYGHESNYFLRYKNLILVAGGAGITPYLALIRDLLKRHELQEEGLPTTVQLVWCVRSRPELSTLKVVKTTKIYPTYAVQEPKRITLVVRAYVTGEKPVIISQPEMCVLAEDNAIPQQDAASGYEWLSAISSNQNMWMIAVIIASITGFVLISALFQVYVVAPRGKNFPTALDNFLFMLSLFLGIVLCGGTVLLVWISKTQTAGDAGKSAGSGEDFKMAHQLSDMEGNVETLLDNCVITEGIRPNFQDVLDDFSEKCVEGDEVGVLVCGPESVQESVAAACRSRNFGSWKRKFHFHSLSFDM